jgi:hypothetical protein
MEEIQQIMIPTLSRAKISRNLSYPVGAKSFSAALASTVQLPELRLQFYSGFDIGLRRGHYEFLRVEYLNNARRAEKWPISSLCRRSSQGQWEVVVQPVPRVRRHQIKQYILENALPQITHWLGERAQLTQRGNDILAFFYDDKAEEFTSQQLAHLEPLQHRGK